MSDIQSEAGIIGTLIEKPEYILYSEQLIPRHFFDTTNGCLYWAIRELYATNITNIDSYNLLTVINTNTAVKKQVGEEITPSSVNDFLLLARNVARRTPEEYIRLTQIVMNCAFKRTLVTSLEDATKLCFSDSTGVELYRDVQKKMDGLTTEYVEAEVQPFSKLIRPLWDESRKKLEDEGSLGYKPLITELQHYFNYTLGELVMYVGKRKVGKSLYAMNEAVNLLKQDVGLLYIDTELSDRLFKDRIIAHLAKVSFKRIQSGDYDDDSRDRIEKAIRWLETRNFYHYHMPMYDKDKLYLLAKKLQKHNGVNFIIFDHLKTTESKDSSGAYYELGNKANFLKDTICSDLGFGGICLAQQNRMGEIGESYRLEQEVSAFVYINEKSKDEIMYDGEECGTRKLFVKGNRLGGQMGDEDDYIDLGFRGHLCTFDNVKQHIDRKEVPF